MTRRLTLPAAGLVALAIAWTAVAEGPAGPATPGAAVPGADKAVPASPASDLEMVEKLRVVRSDYQATLEKLYRFYTANNDRERADAAAEELKQFHRMNKYPYRLELDVPPPTLEPRYNVPDANELYKRAMYYKDRGIGSELADNQRRAELLLQQLLTTYPQCDKIDRAAYQLGDLYENPPFGQKRRAAAYFERVYQWNPRTGTDARMRAARIYDKAGLDRTRAIEIYKAVLNNETDAGVLAEAEKRVAVLTGRK
jgi:TolA-binding protein